MVRVSPVDEGTYCSRQLANSVLSVSLTLPLMKSSVLKDILEYS